MKKNLLCALVCMFIATTTSVFGLDLPESTRSQLSVNTLQSLETFEQIECPLREIERRPPASVVEKDYGTSPHIKIQEGTSQNWSGYAAVTNINKPGSRSVSFVTGTWTIPTLTATPDTSYSSIWVGIDGYSSGTVEQIGTEQDWVDGAQQNYAWFEMYPDYSFEIVGFPANNGDLVTGIVSYVGDHEFQLILINYTNQVFTIVPSGYTYAPKAKRSSAEWIVEAPFLNTILPLADFGTVTFVGCEATIRDVTGTISTPIWEFDALTMVTADGEVKALPSDLSNDGSSFSVTWYQE